MAYYNDPVKQNINDEFDIKYILSNVSYINAVLTYL